MTDNKVIRRMARAALENALQRAGIPADYMVLPHQDDHQQLLVVDEREVRWLDEYQSYVKAILYFESSFYGVVAGDDPYRISESKAFIPEDYGLRRLAEFELPFDLTDIAPAEMTAWEELPIAPPRRLPRLPKPRVIRQL